MDGFHSLWSKPYMAGKQAEEYCQYSRRWKYVQPDRMVADRLVVGYIIIRRNNHAE